MARKRHRLAATRQAAGYSQESLAERLGVDRSTVQRWESGETVPQPWLRPRLARALAVTGDQLRTLLDQATATSASEKRAGGSDGTERPIPAPLGQRTAAMAEWSALDTDQAEHVAKAMAEACRYFDGSVVNYFRNQLDNCMANDGERGPVATLPTVLGLLGAIEQHSRDVSPTVRRELLSFGSCGAEFAGWLYRDVNDPIRAAFWYDRATEWAQEAGDLPMQGYVLLKKSQMAYDARDALRVFTLAQAAGEGPWQLPTNVRAEVTQQQALGMAMLGEPMSAVERRLDEAHQLLAQATADDGRPTNIGKYFTLTTLRLRNASSFTEAGKPSRAAALFGDVLENDSLSRRDSGYFRARRAAALALSGEPDEAATVGLVSVDVASTMTSRRTLRVLIDVVRTLTPWQSRPIVSELRDAVAAHCRSS